MVARIPGRGVRKGRAEGRAVVSRTPISPLGELDPSSGTLVPDRPLRGRILVFPYSRGSTVGSYIIYRLAARGLGPIALVTAKPDPITVVGTIISEIPMVTDFPIEVVREGDLLRVDGEAGFVEFPELELIEAVSVIPYDGTRILILRRSEKVEHNRGLWEVPSGRVERGEGPEEAALRELEEETGLVPEGPLTPCGTHYFRREDAPLIGRVHYFLAPVKGEPRLGWEHVEYMWTGPELPNDTVPRLREIVRECLERLPREP